MQLTSIIVDSEDFNVDLLGTNIESESYGITKVIATANNFNSAKDLINKLKPSILFLGVQLGVKTSIDLLSEIEPYKYVVIFITESEEFIIDSFRHRATYCIKKPINSYEVSVACKLAWKQYYKRNFIDLHKLKRKVSSFNFLKNKPSFARVSHVAEKGDSFIRINMIEYVKSEKNGSKLYLSNSDSICSKQKILHYSQIKGNQSFFRIHNDYVVNLNKVVSIVKASGSFCRLSSGVLLPISKSRYTKLNSFLKLV